MSADERLALLEELLAVAEATGALPGAREAKQRALDAPWNAP